MINKLDVVPVPKTGGIGGRIRFGKGCEYVEFMNLDEIT